MKAEYNAEIQRADSEEEKRALIHERDEKINILKEDLERKQQMKVQELKIRHKEQEQETRKKVR